MRNLPVTKTAPAQTAAARRPVTLANVPRLPTVMLFSQGIIKITINDNQNATLRIIDFLAASELRLLLVRALHFVSAPSMLASGRKASAAFWRNRPTFRNQIAVT